MTTPVDAETLFLEGRIVKTQQHLPIQCHRRLERKHPPGRPFAKLTPAFAYQLFVPLIIILLGHNAVVRERSASTLTLAMDCYHKTFLLVRTPAGKLLSLLCRFRFALPNCTHGCRRTFQRGGTVGRHVVIDVAFCLPVRSWVYLAIWSLLTLTVSLVSIAPKTFLARTHCTCRTLVSHVAGAPVIGRMVFK